MVIEESKSHINSFVKGMNSDGSYDQLEEGQYVYGQNIRIAKNQPLNGHGDYSSLHEGIVTPVANGVPIHWGAVGDHSNIKNQTILSVKSVDNLVVMVTTKGTDINVYRFYIDEESNFVNSFKLIWRADDVIERNTKQLSTVLYKELDNVIKFYIATGTTPIVCLRVDDDSVDDLYEEDEETHEITYAPIDDLINNRIVPEERIHIDSITSGRLPASQVQYTYRYYNKYGNTTQLAPLTNKIQIIDTSRAKENGNAEGTETSIGLTISIDIDKYRGKFGRLQIYRLQYIKPIEDAEVCLIYDGEVKQDVTGRFILHDVGIDPLQKITMEEFAAMSGLILIPKTIEQNQEYMFCGNVKDDTIIKNASLPADYIRSVQTTKFKRTRANVMLAQNDSITGDIPSAGNILYKDDQALNQFMFLDVPSSSFEKNTTVTEYLEERGVSGDIAKSTYNDIITSSLLRSLRRGETYKYGIVFYDKYGRRTDVLDLGEVQIRELTELRYQTFDFDDQDNLIAHPIGLNILIPQVKFGEDDAKIQDIIGCQIVRRSSSDIYQKTLLQVALARPIQQSVMVVNVDDFSNVTEDTFSKSPFYPTGLLTVNALTINPSAYTDPVIWWYDTHSGQYNDPAVMWAKTKNSQLFQIFSSEIDLRRDDVLSRLNISDSQLKEVQRLKATFARYKGGSKVETYPNDQHYLPQFMTINYESMGGTIRINRFNMDHLSPEEKSQQHWIFDYYTEEKATSTPYKSSKIKNIKDVRIPNWEDSYTNVVRSTDNEIMTAISKYKDYCTTIDKYQFNNWVSFGKYDFNPGRENRPGFSIQWNEIAQMSEMLSRWEDYTYWVQYLNEAERGIVRVRLGWIGAGSSCFLATTEEDLGDFPIRENNGRIYTSICNIEHTPKTSDVESDEFVQYFGFGNYFQLKYDSTKKRLVTKQGKDYLTVFDGDVYITPHEFTTLYKTYNFESADTLQSTQIVNYVPLESKVNTYFDYGMNMMNTSSSNLLYEPGEIDGITSQERPAHQYNMVYSDNDSSNDVFTLITTDPNETKNFKQRAYYSELKENGEFIDNFLIFKPACFIDVDSKYGQITNLLTDKNTLYYWQDHAFGRFSVNERSLVNDQNNNTIMLGQAGILSRYDYISTKYGMRLYDFCGRSVEQGVYWVDINNKAIVAASSNEAINYGERVNVQNIINHRIDGKIAPQVDYDLQNSEVLCKCFGNDQIVFNTKYNAATSIYTREYNSIAYIKNHIYGIKIDSEDINIEKYNYIKQIDTKNLGYLSPLKLEYIVNPVASITKVFDSQQLIPIKRDQFLSPAHILLNTKLSFETDIIEKYFGTSMEPYTDREGNIIYNIPRYNNEPYGNRIRGKWMKVNIENSNPSEYFTISHIITTFRQSFS